MDFQLQKYIKVFTNAVNFLRLIMEALNAGCVFRKVINAKMKKGGFYAMKTKKVLSGLLAAILTLSFSSEPVHAAEIHAPDK